VGEERGQARLPNLRIWQAWYRSPKGSSNWVTSQTFAS